MQVLFDNSSRPTKEIGFHLRVHLNILEYAEIYSETLNLQNSFVNSYIFAYICINLTSVPSHPL